MNTNKLFTYFLMALCYTVTNESVSAQPLQNWKQQLTPAQTFIENKGQFPLPEYLKQQSLYALDYGKLKIHITAKGLVYQVLSEKVKTHAEREQIERKMRKAGKSHMEIEAEEHKVNSTQEFVTMYFENASTISQIEVKDKNADYFSYSFNNPKGNEKHIDNIYGYKTLTLKNIYPNIDLEYTTNVTEGLKYAFIVNAGGDANIIKMNYNSTNITLKNNNVIINTLLGKVIDHSPKTFYASETKNIVESKFVKNANTIGFYTAPYDHSKTLVIDPWIQTPAINNSQAVWECERDGTGNAYIIAGDSPMKLLKYNSAGVLQWTYVTPYDTSANPTRWLGTLATDLVGNSYVTNGAPAAIQKISPSGSLLWNKTSSGNEFWAISFNCDQSKLIVGGTNTFLQGTVFDIDVASGAILSNKVVSSTGQLIPPKIQEVRAISATKNSKYFYLTLDTIGVFSQNFGACGGGSNNVLKAINSGFGLSYKNENYRISNSGIAAIKANDKFVYTHAGNKVEKRSLSTLAILASIAIPGGVISVVPFVGGNQVENSGIDLDTCGNVYVGSKNGVYKFDANLSIQLDYKATTFNVYDVAVSTGGNVFAAGATGTGQTSTPRNGTVQSFNMGACYPIKLECCDATICNVPDKCATDASFQLTPTQTGGIFSGGAYVSATGVFNPATAGAGIFNVIYTLPCGSDTLKITVKACATLVVCKNSNGSLQVSAGTAPYTWEKVVKNKDCTGFCAFDCTLPQCTTYVTTYVNISNTTTATTSAATDTVRVKDSQGNEVIIYDQSTLPSCNNCTFTPVIVLTQQPTTCSSTDGSATVTPIAGATYSWNTTPVQTNNVATGLSTGSYTCTVTVGACSTTVSITIPCIATLIVCKNTNGSLQVSGGSGPYTWQVKSTTTDCSGCPGATCIPFVCAGTQVTTWSTFTTGLTATAPNTTDSLRVKDVNGNTVLLANATTPTACSNACSLVANIIKQTAASCGANNGTAVVTNITGATYSWNTTPTQTNDTAINLTAGTYICTVTQGVCTDTAKVTILASVNITASITAQTAAICGATNGTAVVTNIAGATYNWNTTPTQTNDTAVNLAAGTYICTVTKGGCTDTAQVTIAAAVKIAAIGTTTTATCGNNNGTATALVTGSSANYTYSWNTNPVQTTQTITGLASGVYVCTVTPLGGNASCADTAMGLVTSSPNLVVNITGDTILCLGSSTTLTANSVGATSYTWGNAQVAPSITVTPTSGIKYYKVTVSDGTCTGTDSIRVNTIGTSAYILGDTLVCLGDAVALTASIGDAYLWAPAGQITRSIIFIANNEATYSVQIYYANAPAACSTRTASIVIKIHAYNNNLDAGPNQTITLGDAASLTATGANGTSGYTWITTNETTPNISVKPKVNTVYTVQSIDSYGCVNKDSVLIKVEIKCGDLFMPTAFSPNDDGSNDIQCVLGNCVTSINWAIYDRWGERVFESNNIADCWNGMFKGAPLNTGVYVYKLTAILSTGNVVTKNGNITLTR